MTLEDFEKSLADGRKAEPRSHNREEREAKHRKHHHHHRHHDKRRHHEDDAQGQQKHKRARHSTELELEVESRRHDTSRGKVNQSHHVDMEQESPGEGEPDRRSLAQEGETEQSGEPRRDSWMEMPSQDNIEFRQAAVKQPSKPSISRSTKTDFQLKIHQNELNKHHLQDLAENKVIAEQLLQEPAQHEVSYVFGDAGSQWRMTKLKAVLRQAEKSGKAIEAVAVDQYGDLRAFDDAREEQTELDRRQTYGPGYVGKEKPSGDLFAERKLDEGIHRVPSAAIDDDRVVGSTGPIAMETQFPLSSTAALDHTALNRLKARMMKAKLRGAADAASLENEYNATLASSANAREPGVVVLGTMENRKLAGGRNGEVKNIDNKRGRERGLVEENEDMSIDDMVREERRTRHQLGGEGQRYAERIAKDGKFDASQNNLDYMDENAAKLAKRVHKSEINIKNSAVSDFQKMNRILDNCPLCHHEETNSPPVAPVVSLATRSYLTLPTEPEISDGGASIVPIQHRVNLLECDDDEWEEIRNFMKSLTRMYHDQGRDVIFYENASAPQRKRHAALEVVPLPYSIGDSAPAFFKEAFLTSDEEWTQHKKVIDTLSKAKQGLGKLAFRRTLVKEMPYFHVWFQVDGGLGHVVEDSNRWPKGDLFAREVIGGMLDKGPEVIKKQGHWTKGVDGRVDGFRKRWRRFDWTRVLTDE